MASGARSTSSSVPGLLLKGLRAGVYGSSFQRQARSRVIPSTGRRGQNIQSIRIARGHAPGDSIARHRANTFRPVPRNEREDGSVTRGSVARRCLMNGPIGSSKTRPSPTGCSTTERTSVSVRLRERPKPTHIRDLLPRTTRGWSAPRGSSPGWARRLSVVGISPSTRPIVAAVPAVLRGPCSGRSGARRDRALGHGEAEPTRRGSKETASRNDREEARGQDSEAADEEALMVLWGPESRCNAPDGGGVERLRTRGPRSRLSRRNSRGNRAERKWCCGCLEWHPLDAFRPSETFNRRGGLGGYCREYRSAAVRRWRRTKPGGCRGVQRATADRATRSRVRRLRCFLHGRRARPYFRSLPRLPAWAAARAQPERRGT